MAIETPAAVVDVDRLERNLERWQAFCDAEGLANPVRDGLVVRLDRAFEQGHCGCEIVAVHQQKADLRSGEGVIGRKLEHAPKLSLRFGGLPHFQVQVPEFMTELGATVRAYAGP